MGGMHDAFTWESLSDADSAVWSIFGWPAVLWARSSEA
jgi:hypothetical protein